MMNNIGLKELGKDYNDDIFQNDLAPNGQSDATFLQPNGFIREQTIKETHLGKSFEELNKVFSPNALKDSKNINRQHKKVPKCFRNFLATSTGFSFKSFRSKPFTFDTCISLFFYLITFLSGLIFMISTIWFAILDGISKDTKNTILTESGTIVLSFIWFSLGTYPMRVIRNLYTTKTLEEAIRMNTKSFFKIPSSVIILILVTGFCYSMYKPFDLKYCSQIDCPSAICFIKHYFTYIYSAFAILWNYFLALTVMSINRTYTIGIRKFLYFLEQDSLNASKISAEFEKNDGKSSADTMKANRHSGEFEISNQRAFNRALNDIENEEDNIVEEANIQKNEFDNVKTIQIIDLSQLDFKNESNFFPEKRVYLSTIIKNCSACQYRFGSASCTEIKNYSCTHILSPNKIGNTYWNFIYELKLFSRLTQRWIFSLLSCLFILSISCLIKWIDNKDPSIQTVIEFISPLLILAVLCGTYAEANAEGSKLVQVISPLEERVRILNFFTVNPIQVRVFGFSLDYSAELKFIGAFVVGFITQIIFHEISK